jgi:hypothetical protein
VPDVDTDPATFANELRNAADWVNHQMDPVPDWDGLLLRAADELEAAMSEIPSRENAAAKARRYLTEGRITIYCADRHGKVRALVRGDGAIWLVKVDGLDRSCSCPAPKLCAHILAVGLVTAPYQPEEDG